MKPNKITVKTAGKLFFLVIFTVAFLSSPILIATAQDQGRQKGGIGRKEVPEITFQNLFPPYPEYDYFRGHKEHPFQFNAHAFNLTNAWWLAEAATLVYSDENFVRSRFAGAGLPKVVFFDKKSTQCFVASNDRYAIIAFRGSELMPKEGNFDPDKMGADWKADLDIRLLDWDQGGKVHRGFKDALEEVWPELNSHIGQLDRKGCRIWITGHSLGAALATLAASRYGMAQGVYAYGSPRVGDEVFRKKFKPLMYRIVNRDDIVTRMPPQEPFFHVGRLKYIDGHGTLRDQVVDNQQDDNSYSGIIPSAIRDHVPLLYAILLWNNLVDEKTGTHKNTAAVLTE